MADSEENSTASDDFADDLDAMLNDADTSNDDIDEFIDDKDAIDRLLMNDDLDSEEQFAEIDEFAEEPESATETASDNTVDNSEIDQSDEIDEFTEDAADTAEQNNEITEDVPPVNPEEIDEFSEIPEEDSDDDFLMADFDISSEEEDEEEDEDEFGDSSDSQPSRNEPPIENQKNIVEKIAETAPAASATSNIASNVSTSPSDSQVNTEELAQLNTHIDGINAQISQLWADNEDLKTQLTELSTAAKADQNNATTDDIEALQTELRKLKKSINENANKTPIITYIALGIAIIALLVGSGLGIIGFNAQTEVTDLKEIVIISEEEIELLVAKDSTKDRKQIHQTLDALSKKDKAFKKQLKTINKALQVEPLKPVVDDLIVQNNHAQEAIELLLAKVETLENRKPTVAPRKKKKVKKVVPKIKWVVNLIAFKQEWYAKRKATEFDKKGIPAEVAKVIVNGETWFRLTVKGFNSKYEAAAYAVKVKKTLNLSSAWVTKAK